MSFSYSPDLSVPLNYIRWRTNDTEEEYVINDDEVITFFIQDMSADPLNPTRQELNKISLKFLKKTLNEILTAPSRERSGAFEVYGPSAESLKLAIAELEQETSTNSPPEMYAGGIYLSDVCQNRNDERFTKSVFDKDEFFNKECCGDTHDSIWRD